MIEQTESPSLIGTAPGDPDGARLAVLRVLAINPDMSQRKLSDALGLSLGKTHYVLHALLDKGLVKARNFRRSDRKAAYAYMLTAAGIREKARLTKAFLRRKEAEYDALREMISMLKSDLNG